MHCAPGHRMFFVCGTGHYSQEAVPSLARCSTFVRVLHRKPAPARSSLGEGPEFFEGEILSASARLAALEGMTALVIAVSGLIPAIDPTHHSAAPPTPWEHHRPSEGV